jgi:transcription antitermination factor NusG
MNGDRGVQESAMPNRVETEGSSWYALHTRVHREKLVERRLRALGLSTFLPVTTEVHRWSDRQKVIELPLFASYVFVQLDNGHSARRQVLGVDGIVGLVGDRGRGTPIPDSQIDAVRTLVTQKISCSPRPFLTVGQRVRVRGGALDGVEGVLLACERGDTLVVSVDVLGRSLGVSVAGYQVEALPTTTQSCESTYTSAVCSFPLKPAVVSHPGPSMRC